MAHIEALFLVPRSTGDGVSLFDICVVGNSGILDRKQDNDIW